MLEFTTPNQPSDNVKPGIYDNITNEQYHGGPGESKSLLDLVRRSPVHYLARKIAANENKPSEPTAAQRIGTAFHALLLEPHVFVQSYCLALRPQDVDTAASGQLVESKDQLIAMIEELNKGRLPKLSTSGTKDELVARIREHEADLPDSLRASEVELQSRKLSDLKDIIAGFNVQRPGLLSTTGTMEALAQTLRDAGRPVTLWAEVKAEWARNNASRQVLTQEEWDQLHRMRDAVMAHPAANALMTGAKGYAEQSVYWRDPTTGLLCRCRPDFWRVDGIIVDVKTTDDASAEGFARSIAKWRYHVQAPYYLDGIAAMQDQMRDPFQRQYFANFMAPPKAFVFLAVEKSACVVDGTALGVGVYVLDNESMEFGRVEYSQDLATIARCTESGAWPGYGDKIQPISLPRWKLAQGAE